MPSKSRILVDRETASIDQLELGILTMLNYDGRDDEQTIDEKKSSRSSGSF